MESTFYILMAVVFWGLAPVFGKLGLEKIDPLLAISIRTIGLAAIVLIVLIFTGRWEEVGEVDPRSGALILLEGVFAGLLGHFAYYFALKAGEVSKTVLLVRGAPIITVVLGVLVFGEKLSFTEIGGMVLIISGSVLMSL
jgi:transporter family protein